MQIQTITKTFVISATALAATTILFSGCSTTSPESTNEAVQSKEGKRAALESNEKEISFSGRYDEQIKLIFQHAEEGRWEEAETESARLYESDPSDPAVQRLNSWVQKQRNLLRSQAIEDQIRRIDAKNSVFNPTVGGLLQEQKDRGLPPRKDLRDAVQQLESTPYIPDTFGKTITEKGKLFSIESTKGRMANTLEKIVSVHLTDATLETIIFELGEDQGINFVADKTLPAFKQKLSINMDNAKLSELLRYISRNMKIHFQIGDDLIWIVGSEEAAKLFEETRFYRLKRGFIMPAQFGASKIERTTRTQKDVKTTTEVQQIEQFVQDGAAQEPSIEQAIKKFFKGSTYMLDYERNLIVASGTVEQFEVLEKIIEEFDTPIQQVLIEARFVTVTEAAFMELGAIWETGRARLTSREAVDFTGLGTNVGLGLEESVRGILGRDDLSVTIRALEQSGETQTLSAPRVTLVNNLPATISDGKVQYYYEEYSVTQEITDFATSSSLVPSGKPTKITSGVSLDVIASIGGDGQTVLLALNPEVNQDVKLVSFATISDVDAGGTRREFDIRLPESRTQSLSTRVIVRSGETAVMGGVLEREQNTFVESVPVLSNVPVLGSLFRKRIEFDKPRYLLIFVTATILSETGEFLKIEPPVTQ